MLRGLWNTENVARPGPDRAELIKGLLAGALGGLAGAWAMNQYHILASSIQGEPADETQGGREAPGRNIGGPTHNLRSSREIARERLHLYEPERKQQQGQTPEHEGSDAENDDNSEHATEQSEPATEKSAAAVVTGLFGHQMTPKEKRTAGSAAHYAFGATVGGVYGVLAETSPLVRVGMGTAFGASVWLTADEIAVPALGLSRPPQHHASSTHLNALATHLIFGITVELMRRMLRKLLS